MTEALHDLPPSHSQPFADDGAGMQYFDSEAHHRLLAETLLAQLQQGHRIILITGETPPNAELLARLLGNELAPPCRATVIKGNAQLSADGLMNSYRKLLGIAIAEETLKRAAGVPPLSVVRAYEHDLLVLDNADALNDEVLDDLCRASENSDEQRPALLLLARYAFLQRLTADSLEAVSDAITARLQRERLAQQETADFIGFQMKSCHLDHRGVFRAPIIELIGIYADGDPSVVNGLARRVWHITQTASAKSGEQAAAAPAPSDEVVPFPEAETPSSAAAEEIASFDEPVAAEPASASEPPDAASAAPEETAESGGAPAASPERDAELAAPEDVPTAAAVVASASVVGTESEFGDAEEEVPRDAEGIDVQADADREDEAAEDVSADEVGADEIVEPVRSTASTWTVELPPGFDPAEEIAASEEDDALANLAAADLARFDAEIEANSEEDEPIDGETDESATLAEETEEGDETAALEEEDDAGDREIAAEYAADRRALTLDDGVALPEPRAKPPRRGMRQVLIALLVAMLAIVALLLGFDAVGPGIAHDPRLKPIVMTMQSATAKLQHGWEALRARFVATSTPVQGNEAAAPAREPPLRTTTQNVNGDLVLPSPSPPPSPNKEATSASSNPVAPVAPPAATIPAPAASKAAGGSVIEPLPAPAGSPAPLATATPPTQAAPMPQAALPPASAANPATAAPPKQTAVAPAITDSPLSAPPTAAPSALSSGAATPPKQTALAPGLTAAPSAAAPSRSSGAASPTDVNLLMTRGDKLLASGDIIAARHYFELVAETGDSRVALRLGETYDPVFLKQIGARGIAGDPAVAKSWYLKAIASGDKGADMRLLQLMALYPE